MEQRHAGLPFSRPQSQQNLRDPRFTSIPTSQYASQPSTPLPETLHKHDPFLRRRNDLDDRRRSPSIAQAPQQYALPSGSQHPTNHYTAVQDPSSSASQLRRNSHSSGPIFGASGMDRLGSKSSEGADVRESLPPFQPSTPFNFSSLKNGRILHENAEVPPTNRSGSPRAHGGSEHPPPAPSFTGRQMLPPSPQFSQSHHIGQTAPIRQPPASLPFTNGRELPALSTPTLHRPTSNMSISSMLDSDNAKPLRESGPLHHSNGPSSVVGNFSTSLSYQSRQATSPPRVGQVSNLYPESSTSPDKYQLHQTQANRPYRSYSGGLEQRPQPYNVFGSPETAGNSSLNQASFSQYSPKSLAGPQNEWRSHHHEQESNNGCPNSQPTGIGTPQFEADGRMQLGEVERLRQQQTARKHYLELEESNRENPVRQINGKPMVSIDFTQQKSQPSQGTDFAQIGAHLSPKQHRLSGSRLSFASQHNFESQQLNPRLRSEVGRPFDRTNQSTTAVQSPFSPDTLRRLREERHQQSASHSPSKHQPATNNHIEERQAPKYPGPPVTFASSTEGPVLLDANDQQQSKEDVAANNRSALAMLIENSRRGGRFSPLPQAVQGAQGRTSGPASDPGIKNEFGRMFSGIGSGVGSAGPNGSGTNTPFPPPSPTMSHGPQRRTPFGNHAGSTKIRTTSKSTRKGRKVRDDESKPVLEDAEGGTPTGITGRAVRKSRASHHHHSHHVHHGHRHHNVDDAESSNGRATPTLVNGKRLNTPSQVGVGSHKHHSHHHGSHHPAVHHHHHHHQEPKPPRVPTTSIRNDAVLDSIRHLPRHHLGSVAYSSTLEPASATASRNTKLGYQSTPTPMPRYEGKENCTYTVHIPKIYLEAQEREAICRRRALWGTDIYTDDSDVLAAAMHSGWIRGEFGEGIDPSMLEVKKTSKADSKADKSTKKFQAVFTSIPDEPLVPPLEKELHLTLVVLPALEKYASHVAHGIKSRSWGSTHDGVSFRIEKMEWVHERNDRDEDRSGESRRKRMRSHFGGRLGGPPVRLHASNLAAGNAVDVSMATVAIEV